MGYQGIVKDNNINAADVVAALDSKVSLAGNEDIYGIKTFNTEPEVPSKTTAVTSSGSATAIATEAQVYATAATKANANAVVDLSTNQLIKGIKTFSTSSPLVPPKSSAPVNANGTTVIATEAQVYAAMGEFANKANDKDVVKLTTDQTIAGVKKFTTSPVIPAKTGMPSSTTSNAIATEAQVYAASLWQ
jgi:hypothetical protein